MEKTYKIGRIYKITSPHTDKVYIGSTVQSLEDRFSQHLSAFSKYETTNKYCSSFEVLELGNCKISLLEELQDVTLNQLRMREGEVMVKHNYCNFRIESKAKATETKRQCECGLFYTHNHKSRHQKSETHQMKMKLIMT